ncbi:MAG: FAD binding domain-containing protein [Bacillota bacterium]
MITIEKYVKPKDLSQAYDLLNTNDKAAIVGGGFFMRLASRKIGLAIDLSGAGLDFIRETDDHIEIGAMATFSQLERSSVLHKNLAGIIPLALANIPGVQMKNMVSVGGTIYSKYGFSELLTALMVLDCRVALYKKGRLSLAEFFNLKDKTGDILERVLLKKEPLQASYKMFRNSAGGLPILSAAVSKGGAGVKIAVGARPAVAAQAVRAIEYLNGSTYNKDSADEAGAIAAAELTFTTDRMASAEYRRQLCQVLVRRALMEVEG